jgi:hypothetical protein
MNNLTYPLPYVALQITKGDALPRLLPSETAVPVTSTRPRPPTTASLLCISKHTLRSWMLGVSKRLHRGNPLGRVSARFTAAKTSILTSTYGFGHQRQQPIGGLHSATARLQAVAGRATQLAGCGHAITLRVEALLGRGERSTGELEPGGEGSFLVLRRHCER